MFNTQLFEQQFGWTEAGDTTLQQVKANKRGKPEPVTALIKGTSFHAQRHGNKNKAARHNADDTFDSHVNYLTENIEN